MLKLSFKFGGRIRGGKASAFGVRGVSIWTNPQTGKKCPRIRFTLYDSETYLRQLLVWMRAWLDSKRNGGSDA